MDKTTLRLPSGTLNEIDDEVEEEGYQSRADYLRAIVESRHEADELRREATEQRAEYEEKLTEYEERLDSAEAEAAAHRDEVAAEYDERIEELERENERLHRERRQLLAERNEKKELARWAEDQRTIARRHRSRPVWRRAWTWVFGDPNDALKGEA